MVALDPEFAYLTGGRQPVTETFDSYSEMHNWLDDNYRTVEHDDAPDRRRWRWRTYILPDSVQIVPRVDGGYIVHCQIQHVYLSRDPAEIDAVYNMTWDDFKNRRWTRASREAHFSASRVASRHAT